MGWVRMSGFVVNAGWWEEKIDDVGYCFDVCSRQVR